MEKTKVFKKDLLNYLTDTRSKAEKMIKQDYEEKKLVRKAQLLDEIGIDPTEVSRLCLEAGRALDDMVRAARGHDFQYIYNLEKYVWYLERLSDKEELTQAFIDAITFHDLFLEKVILDFERELSATRASYNAIIGSVRNTTDTKKAVQYVRSLGFDLSSIERPDQPDQLPAPVIDLSHLKLDQLAKEVK